jgi:hypothetical protein
MGDERLEGSRFGACHKNLALFLTSRGQPQKRENRRLPETTQRAVPLNASFICFPSTRYNYRALGYSREPPAFTFLGCARDKRYIATS